MQDVVPNNVARCCVEMLRTFGQAFSDEQWDREKRLRNLTNLTEEILERSRGRRRRENFNDNQRKAERNRARDKTPIYNG